MRDAATATDNMPWRVPTLHGKRDGDHLPRKMSSKKRRKEDRRREAEIKAISTFAPHRPAAEDGAAGWPMRKESKKIRSGFGVGKKSSDVERHSRSSDISLPLPESIDSALSSDSDYISYEVSVFESLAPRPTLRYNTHVRSGNYTQDGAGVVRRPSPPRKRLAESIPEEVLRAHKRVDSLADEFSASDLRELMERDQRRRARKREMEQKKLEMKIARQAEKQKAAEAEAQKHGRKSPPNLSRGILGREDVGLGADPPSATITSSRLRTSDGIADDRDEAGDTDKNIPTTHENDRPEPLAAFHRVDSHPLQPQESIPEARENAPALASNMSRASLRNTIPRSKSPQESETKTVQSEQRTRSSGNAAKGPRAWVSLFRWTNRTKRHSGGPPSFSNTSRDSVPTPPVPVPTPSVNPIPRRMTSGVPKRTMSRFREDLPELPTSPPASRLQSPEAEPVPSPVKVSTNIPPSIGELCPSPQAPRPRHDTPVSTRPSAEEMRETPSTFSRPDEPGVSPEPQSLSLASIDSEGSWFAGGLTKKRKSPGLRRSRYPPSHLDGEQRPEIENPNDDMDITEDDYLSRLTPSHGDRSAWNRKSTGEARPSSDWGEEEAHWGNVEGQLPTVVRTQPASRVKSQEGLLRSSGDEGDVISEPMDAQKHRNSDDDATLRRATSVDYLEAPTSH
ncbi:hypothetical protein VTH82DRAFT_4834 [Thermothelomyces myriococcoides]